MVAVVLTRIVALRHATSLPVSSPGRRSITGLGNFPGLDDKMAAATQDVEWLPLTTNDLAVLLGLHRVAGVDPGLQCCLAAVDCGPAGNTMLVAGKPGWFAAEDAGSQRICAG